VVFLQLFVFAAATAAREHAGGGARNDVVGEEKILLGMDC
jgi:hypothetical protein